jgi:hypothetical protein
LPPAQRYVMLLVAEPIVRLGGAQHMLVDANRVRRVWSRPGRYGGRAPEAEAEQGVGGMVVVLESSFRVAAYPFPLPSG